MNIAILSPFYPYRGGIAQFSNALYTALVKDGNNVKAFNFKRLYPNFLFPGKTQYVEPIEQDLIPEGIQVLDSINPSSYYQTVKALKEFNPDVLIISYWMSFFVPSYAFVAKRMKKHCKVITLIHNAIPHEPHFFDKPLASFFFKRCDGFIVMSENVKNDLLSLRPDAKYILNPHPLYDFGNIIDKKEARDQLQIDPNKKTLLFFGLIRDYKGLDLLIDAMNQLDDEYQLIVAGEVYGSFEKYKQQIDQSLAKDRIYIHNQYISDEEVPVFFSAADALILPYRSATQSGVVSIAYHFNLPMLATPVGDFKDSIEKPSTGIVTSEITASAISKGIAELFQTEKYHLFLTNITKEKTALSWETLTKKLFQFIKTELY